MKFLSLYLAPELQQAIKACGYSTMTPVQEQAITPAILGKDILANAQTGTGKTAAFALPILQQMVDKPKARVSGSPRALILAPTRELAEQLAKSIADYAQFLPLSVTALYGGVKMSGQEKKLRAGVDILISTPGRLLEHIGQCNVNLASVEFVVLDEADRMLDMGFITDVQSLLKLTAKKCQTMLFSATLSPAVNELAKKILHKPEVVRVARQNATADTVEHVMYTVDESRKLELFMLLLAEYNWYQVLVFTSTKDQADTLMASLKKANVEAALCHGDKSQGSRRRALADFKDGKIQVLIATEVAARGLDIQGLEFVVNYNLPYLAEDYVHRIGRTGRAGSEGQAISFVSREEERSLKAIEQLIGGGIKRIKKTGFDVKSRDMDVYSRGQQERPERTNKTSQTKIIREKVTKNKAKTGGTQGLAAKTAKAKPSSVKVEKAKKPAKPGKAKYVPGKTKSAPAKTIGRTKTSR
jgi:ATP-dependent RNA helicase RhlE